MTGNSALITGVTGQDGYYLSELLLRNGFEVHAVLSPDRPHQPVRPDVMSHRADLTSAQSIADLSAVVAPDFVFHLAGISSVAQSWREPVPTTQVNSLSTAVLLDACLQAQERSGKKIVLVNASSCEIFAGAPEPLQDETTPLRPVSPYGASKALGFMLCQVYRTKGLEAANAILYNHESPRRPEKFVTRKITKAVARIAAGRQDRLALGDLSIMRDWGWAPDYVDAMYRMAVHGKGDDFVIATGVSHSISEFVAAAFAVVGIHDWNRYVQTDPTLLRPADRPAIAGNAAKARAVLDWRPTTSFEGIVKAMVDSDLRQEQSN